MREKPSAIDRLEWLRKMREERYARALKRNVTKKEKDVTKSRPPIFVTSKELDVITDEVLERVLKKRGRPSKPGALSAAERKRRQRAKLSAK